MNLLIIRSKFPCFQKQLSGLDIKLGTDIRTRLRILDNPNSYGITDIQKAKDLKLQASTLSSYAQTCLPLNAVIQSINNLNDEEDVILLDGDKYDNKEVMIWIQALVGKQKGHNPIDTIHYLKYDYPATYHPRHEMYLFTDLGFDQYIGEWDKDKRQCRFCHKQGPGHFGPPKNSHAISYFLGNERLFCLEECKTCNNDFGKGIEQHLANYYEYYRAAGNRKSRKGKPLTSEGFNYNYANGRLEYIIPTEETLKVNEGLPPEGIMIHLDSDKPVVLHNCYRALVKYVLACLPSSMISPFSATIEWVRGKKHPGHHHLPPVYRIETLPNVQHPSLCVYIRKDDKKDLPYCIGELRFMENLYVFALPYCKGHDVVNAQLSQPLATFVAQRYPNHHFTIENFCDDEEKMITSHVKIGGND